MTYLGGKDQQTIMALFVFFALSACDVGIPSQAPDQTQTAASQADVSNPLSSFIPATDAVLENLPPGDWLRWRRDHGATGYSPLDQVTPENVNKLQLAWAWTLEPGGAEQEPIVYRGVMYLPHTNGVVQALDARSGDLLWEYRREFEGNTDGDTTRNIAIYNDKIYLTSPDAYLVALDARTGELAWEVKTGDPDDRVSYSAGPIAGEGRVFAGQTCGTGTTSSCSVGAFDADTGELLWRRESVAGPGDPASDEATWGNIPYEQRRKASFWITGSYDPELALVYWSTASPYPYPEILMGDTKGGDLLYTNSILALDAETGDIRWFFQMQPRDNFDLDQQDNPILADVEINGIIRKVIYLLGKPGILWAFDRETGEHLWNRQLVIYQNIYERIDPETGDITINENLIPTTIGETQLVCPGHRGGKMFQTNAYNPLTGAVYSPVSSTCTNFKVVPLNVSGNGLDNSDLRHMQGSNGLVGRLVATSAATGRTLWTYNQRAALGSVLTTAGKLVFVADLHRNFLALDADNGNLIWKVPLSAPVTGYPISYAADNKQYIAVTVGGGGIGTRTMADLYPELKSANGSNVIVVFALGE
jgi:alcohol dehydrogenase (cytochrome c)